MGFHNSQAKLKRVLRSNPSAFLRKVFHEVNPGEKFFDNWHLDAMAYHLDGCRTNTRKRVLITVPPRSLKSIAASVAFRLIRPPSSAWSWIRAHNEFSKYGPKLEMGPRIWHPSAAWDPNGYVKVCGPITGI
jgi:hypothetical protein